MRLVEGRDSAVEVPRNQDIDEGLQKENAVHFDDATELKGSHQD